MNTSPTPADASSPDPIPVQVSSIEYVDHNGFGGRVAVIDGKIPPGAFKPLVGDMAFRSVQAVIVEPVAYHQPKRRHQDIIRSADEMRAMSDLELADLRVEIVDAVQTIEVQMDSCRRKNATDDPWFKRARSALVHYRGDLAVLKAIQQMRATVQGTAWAAHMNLLTTVETLIADHDDGESPITDRARGYLARVVEEVRAAIDTDGIYRKSQEWKGPKE